METPAITAVIALYNGAAFIAEALNSILAQTLPPARIVVVDDGSTDDGPAIVAGMARSHGILLLRQTNRGQSAARNLAISQTSTPLIALLDQDDIWHPEHLERLAAPFRSGTEPGLGWVYSNLDTIDATGAPIAYRLLDQFVATEHPKRTLTGCLANDMFVVPSSTLVSRFAFDQIGGFDERLTGYEDDDLFFRLFQAGFENIYLPEALCQWRITSGSASNSPHMLRSRVRYFQKLRESPALRRLVDRHVAPRFFEATLFDYQRALLDQDNGAGKHALTSLRAFVPFLNPGTRLTVRAILPLTRAFRIAPIGLAAAKCAPFAWAAYKRMIRFWTGDGSAPDIARPRA